MWKLTIEDDEGQRTTLELSSGEYTIGRAEDATVRLTERNVSRKHAVLKPRAEGGWLVADAGSYNGVFVNGERIEADVPLKAGDIIQLGDYRMEVVDQQDTATAPADEDPRKVRPDRLVMVIGPVPGTEYPLNTDRVSIGRAEDAGVSINHASVSRLHCELVNIGQGRWECVDSGSANGIRINGVELRRGIIEPGDAIELGDVRLRYVAAGKFYRPGAADMSMQMPSVPFESMTHATGAPPAARKGGGTVVMVAAVVAVLILGAAYAFMRPPSGNGTAPAASGTAMAASEAEAKVMFTEAQKTVGDDPELAHRMLGRIPADSPLRESAEFKSMEDKWADFMFAKADSAPDPAEKAKILTKISETETVSAEKRQKAASMAGPSKGQPPIDMDSAGHGQGSSGAGTFPKSGGSSGSGTSAPGTTSAATPEPSSPTTSASSEPPPPSEGSSGPVNPQKAGLQSKMRSGRATENELRMLKAICMGDGDKACRNEAVAALKKLQH